MALNKREIEKAMWCILEAAQRSDWEIIYMGPSHSHWNKVRVGGIGLATTEEESKAVNQAIDKMIHERHWVRQVDGYKHTVTEAGMNALEGRSTTVEIPEVKMPPETSPVIQRQSLITSVPVRRYGVFISSTFLDLKEERQALMRMVLDKQHFPLGMELFGAGPSSALEIIQREIEMCDYYLLAVGRRYGTEMNEHGTSFTEWEFDYAAQLGKPIVPLFLSPGSSWKPESIQADKVEQLKRFKAKVKSTNNREGYWSDRDDLKYQAGLGLENAMREKPQPGWIRGTDFKASQQNVAELTLSEPNPQISVELRIVCEKSNINPQLPQWVFDLEAIGTNSQRSAVKGHTVEMTVPKELVLVNNQYGRLLSQKSSDNEITFEFPSSQGNPLPQLNKGKPGVLGSVKFIIAKHNLDKHTEILRQEIAVEVSGDGIDTQTTIFRLAEFDPFQIMNVNPKELIVGRPMYLPLGKGAVHTSVT